MTPFTGTLQGIAGDGRDRVVLGGGAQAGQGSVGGECRHRQPGDRSRPCAVRSQRPLSRADRGGGPHLSGGGVLLAQSERLQAIAGELANGVESRLTLAIDDDSHLPWLGSPAGGVRQPLPGGGAGAAVPADGGRDRAAQERPCPARHQLSEGAPRAGAGLPLPGDGHHALVVSPDHPWPTRHR